MEKNGNTFAPGDPVIIRSGNTKLGSSSEATIETIDVDTGRARVKYANGQLDFVDVHQLERR
jgi:hypothetical protein